MYILCASEKTPPSHYFYIFFILFLYINIPILLTFGTQNSFLKTFGIVFFIKLSITPENVTALLCVLTELFKKKMQWRF